MLDRGLACIKDEMQAASIVVFWTWETREVRVEGLGELRNRLGRVGSRDDNWSVWSNGGNRFWRRGRLNWHRWSYVRRRRNDRS